MMSQSYLNITVSTIIGLVLFTNSTVAQKHYELNRYIENPKMVAENQEPAHVPLLPFESVEQALDDAWEASAFYQLLNGDWKFHWAENPMEAPEDFYQDTYDAASWEEIRVPSMWQTQGYGHNMYRNIPQALFPYDPPHVPDFNNETGSYRRTFTVPDSWRDRQVFLHFEGVKSASFVWVNGQYVGFDKGGMTPAEYNITSYLHAGENTLAVRVIRWSDGSYLEDQDMWRFSGIYRDVYLFATPEVHIRDFYVRTDLDADYRDATLLVDLDVKSYDDEASGQYTVRAQLFDIDGVRVSQFSGEASVPAEETTTLALREQVMNPLKWSAEKPSLYTLVLELIDADGGTTEILSERVGFREMEIRNGQALINGVAVIHKGTNRHEHHPELGRTMTEELMVRDLELLKQFNFNAVRHSHYPDTPRWYDLADEYGIYLQDEVNAECHYDEMIPASQWPLGQRYANVEAWNDAYMDRFSRMVERDKNHPSVVIWSAGNECGLGKTHFNMAEYAREKDPTRFIYHQTNFPPGTAPFVDIDGPRYPSPGELRAFGESTERPIILGEYAHAMGNSLGHFDEFWDAIYELDRLQGGYIWDWADQGLIHERRTTPDNADGIDATLLGRPKVVEGYRGKALALSGLDDWVEVYNDPALDVSERALTIEAWVYPRGWNGSANPIVTKGDDQYGLAQVDQQHLEFYIQDALRVAVRVRTPGDWNYNWHHVAGVYDGQSLTLYVDGKALGTTSHTYGLEIDNSDTSDWSDLAKDGYIDPSPYPVNIGRNAEVHREQFAGFISNAIIDEVRIYDIALTTEELSKHPTSAQPGAVLWLDFDEYEEGAPFYAYGSSPFLLNGVVFPDRTVQPELWQAKRSHAPVRVEALDLAEGRLRIHNRYHFTNLSELDAGWSLQAEGRVIQEGRLDLDVPPGGSKDVLLPVQTPSIPSASEYWLILTFTLPNATLWAPAGHEVAFDQFLMPFEGVSASMLPISDMPAVDVQETDATIEVSGKDFTYVFDRASGTPASIVYRGQELIVDGPKLNVWRAPIDNEEATWGEAEAIRWRQLGLDRLQHQVRDVQIKAVSEQVVVIEIKTTARAERQAAGFDNEYTYHVFGSGDIVLCHNVVPIGHDMPWLPRMGLQMKMPERFDRMSWYGRGPFETYNDRKTGARTAVFEKTVDEQYVPYIEPSHYGNKTDVRWVAWSDNSGLGLAVFTFEDGMDVSATPYENLDRATYDFQLQRSGHLILNIDHKNSGVGGTPVPPRMRYRTQAQAYDYSIRLRPFVMDEISPADLAKQRLTASY